jgi:Asp/Glu/hydantoin racemase
MNEKRYEVAVVGVTLNAVTPMMEAFRIAPSVPGWSIRNHLDEGLQAKVAAAGGVDHTSLARMIGLVETTVEDGAEAVLLTCTVFSPHVATLQRIFPVPIIAADVAMLETAAGLGRRTAILCTFPASLGSSLAMFRAAGQSLGGEVDGEVFLVDGALDALAVGDRSRHDDLVEASVRAHAADFGAVVLAQMSMAAVVERLPGFPVPILTSPTCAVTALREAIARRRATT